VLSDAFGKFKPALVLHRCVCRWCNQFFGDELEVRFARGAFEGMLRYRKGIKVPPDGAVNLRYLDFAIPEGNGDWSGVRLKLVSANGGMQVELVPQAAFFDKTQERWMHITLDEIEGALSAHPGYKNVPVRLYARSAQECTRLVSLLRGYDINGEPWAELSPPGGLRESPKVEVDVTFRINRGIRRCIAKYAFNYLAFVCGSEFAREADFDTIRRFIRYGEQPDYPLVVAGSTPILYDDRPSERQTDGHLITLSWAESLCDLVSEVSLFNSITYRVSICRQFSGKLWRPIRSGHHYDLATRAVTPLVGFSKLLALPSGAMTRR